MQVNKHSMVKSVGCLMDKTISGAAMAPNVTHKINNKLKFIYCKSTF